MSNLTTGAKMLLECLAREGVDCFFGYPGGVTLPLYDAIYDHHIRHVLVRHEENACFAAEGYARSCLLYTSPLVASELVRCGLKRGRLR